MKVLGANLNSDILLSICIPQYNRIEFLVENLQQIQKQKYPNIEICISDDCSTDDTEATIRKIMATFKYPINYERFNTNQGYDRNLRRAMEMATGQYIFILGNDDTINPKYDLFDLAQFLNESEILDIGFTNYISAHNQQITTRAHATSMLGSGPEVALAYYSSFSFIGGIIIKRSVFLKYNTGTHDGSIYGQMYFSAIIIASGGQLFSIRESVVIKDILPDHEANRISFIDHIPKTWRDYKKLDGGLHSVIFVVYSGFVDSKTINERIIYRLFKKIYGSTFPYWLVEYRRNGAIPAAVGLFAGLNPSKSNVFIKLNWFNKVRVYFIYLLSSFGGLLIPIRLFDYLVINYFKKPPKPQ